LRGLFMSSMVTARDVSFELPNGRELLKDLNFSLDAALVALVGPNGVGKTCLARLIAGEIRPTTGSIRCAGSVKLFPQRESPPAVTVAEYLSADYEWTLRGERLLHAIDRDANCTTLSGGQWMRVRLARALDDDFLILDEPTNDLDREGRAAVLDFLRSLTGGALVISHDRELLKTCDEFLELSNRGLTRFSGGWVDYVEAKERESTRLNAALESAKRERDAVRASRIEQVARQEKRNRRGADRAARGGAPKILLGARERKAQASSGNLDAATLEKSADAVRAAREALSELKIDPVMYADLIATQLPAQKLIAEAHGFNIRLRDWIYRDDLNFSWRGNVRVAVNGPNGSGKSTLLKALLGDVFETRGELRRGELETLYLDQRCSSLDDAKSVFDNIRAVSGASDTEIRNGLARFLFASDAVFQPVSQLSGGERLRAALARGFLGTAKPELVMLDEPTNNLDLTNVEFLEGLIGGFRGALIVISHDEEFLANCGVTAELVVEPSRRGHG
jgi:ATPase subunit of ABC transporter with duplicated ATPase domains